MASLTTRKDESGQSKSILWKAGSPLMIFDALSGEGFCFDRLDDFRHGIALDDEKVEAALA